MALIGAAAGFCSLARAVNYMRHGIASRKLRELLDANPAGPYPTSTKASLNPLLHSLIGQANVCCSWLRASHYLPLGEIDKFLNH